SLRLPDYELVALTNLGHAYGESGDTQNAIRCARQALPLLQAAGLKGGEVAALKAIARAQRLQGDLGAALETGLELLALLESSDPNELGWRVNPALTFLGQTYALLGDPAAALQYLQRCSWGPSGGSAFVYQAPNLEEVADVYAQLGDEQRALEA